MSDRAKPKSLAELGLTAVGGSDVEITGLSVDSREVLAGHLFAALPGTKIHGAEFITYAVRMGAVAILTDREGSKIAREVLQDSNVSLILAQDPRQTLAYAASLWFENQPATLVAITGTNGKTSVAACPINFRLP